jgi:hypothetical protein
MHILLLSCELHASHLYLAAVPEPQCINVAHVLLLLLLLLLNHNHLLLLLQSLHRMHAMGIEDGSNVKCMERL